MKQNKQTNEWKRKNIAISDTKLPAISSMQWKKDGMMQVRPCQRSMYVILNMLCVYIFSNGMHIIQYAVRFQEWDDNTNDNDDDDGAGVEHVTFWAGWFGNGFRFPRIKFELVENSMATTTPQIYTHFRKWSI